MATYVVVHGAWSGAHGFRRVRRALHAAGHEVFTPSLTGVGERAHLLTPLIDLTTHIHDVVNLVLYEDLDDIVLVGFSYGGAVVTGAVAHIAGRIRELVYLDAFVPGDGVTVAELAGRPGSRVLTLGQEWAVPPPPRPFDDPDEAAWQNARRGPHPARCFTEPVRLTTPLEAQPFGLTFIKATDEGRDAPGGDAFWTAAEHAERSPRWRYYEIATTHMVASNRPDELTRILLELA
jgi:pimeloyl-ACP methyl ester carboxylesterase